MSLTSVLVDAQKAVGVFVAGETAAVAAGLIDGPTSGFITGITSAVLAAIAYALGAVGKPAAGQHEAK